MASLPSELSSFAAPQKAPTRPTQPAAVLVTVKGKSLCDGLRPPLTVTARGRLARLPFFDGQNLCVSRR
jgi:hypothetical protein